MYTVLQRSREVSADIMAHKKTQPVPVNQTGLPDRLKSGIESLSGYSMDHVRVHYHSSRPARLHASAYAQGMDIHVASGQERHLPHEAWHVVQQMQGRVRPAMQVKGMAVNNDPVLEREADIMGAKAVQCALPHGTIRKQTFSKSCLQAKLPSGVRWNQSYRNIGDTEEIVSGRTIGASKELVQGLDRFFRRTGYFKDTLEQDDGLRRLAEDIKFVRKKVKSAQDSAAVSPTRAPAVYAEFVNGNQDTLRNAQHLVNDKIKEIENRKYSGSIPAYVNEEDPVHFRQMKRGASTMIGNVLRKNNAYLQQFFNPAVPSVAGLDAFYDTVRDNYNKINRKLPAIGFKNNYSRRRGVFGYVYPGAAQQPPGTHIGGEDVSETFIRSRMQRGVETGLQIRLSSAYRRAAETGGDSKPGVIIHEASHLILGTKDFAYGRGIYTLSRGQAEKNADTYEYAAENA